MAEQLTENMIRMYASVFAETFKRQGVMSANPEGAEPSSGVDTRLNDFETRKKERKLIEQNNKLLDEYGSIQEDLNNSAEVELRNAKRRKRIESDLNDSSIVLGNSYMSFAETIRNGALTSSEISDFTNNTELSRLSQNFTTSVEDSTTSISSSMSAASRIYEDIASNLRSAASRMTIPSSFLLLASLKQFTTEFRAGLKYGADLSRSHLEREVNALKMGISPADLIELEAKNKRLVNAMGGVDSFEEAIGKGSQAMFKFHGDLGESTKSTTQALHALSLGGIKPSLSAMVDQNGAMSKLNKTMFDIRSMTGKTFPEQNVAMEEYIKSDITKTKLAALSNSAERLNMIQRDQSNKRLFDSMGLAADQSIKLSETFNSITGLDPKERLKESYKAQAIASAMGIENASIIGDVMRAGGIDKVSADVAEKYTLAMEQISKKQAQSSSGQITASGLFTSQLLNSSTTLKEQAQASRDLILADKTKKKDLIDKANDEFDTINENAKVNAISDGIMLSDMAKSAITGNALLTGLLGTVGAIVYLMKTGSPNLGTRRSGRPNRGAGAARSTSGSVTNAAGRSGRPNRVAGVARSISGSVTNGARRAAGSLASGVRAVPSALTAVTAAGSLAGGARAAAGLAGKVVSKLGPIGLAIGSVYGAVDGWNDVGENFDDSKITLGMKAASALGGTLSSLSMGLIDAKSSSNFVHGMFDSDDSGVKPVTKSAKILEMKKKEIKESSKRMEALQEELIKVQTANMELMKLNNGILENNFDKLHQANIKTLQSSHDIKGSIEQTMEGIIPQAFNDVSTVL